MQSETSRRAYRNLNQKSVASEKQQIRELLQKVAPFALTDRQITANTGLARNIVWSRRAALVKKGEVIPDKIVKDHITKQDAQSWRIKNFGGKM